MARPNATLSLPPLVFDGLLAVALFAFSFVSRLEVDADTLAPFRREPDGLNLLLTALMTLPLVLRRVHPIPVFVLTLLTWGADRVLDYPATTSSAAVVLVFHSIGSELPRRMSTAIGVPVVVAVSAFTVLGAVTLESVTWGSAVFTLLATAVPLLLGREVHERRRRFTELEERAERAEREREARAKQAVADERARIARELHDVVAHQMTVMTLQAEGAHRVAGSSDPRIVEALGVIRDAGREALGEMRRMVGLLRDPDAATPDMAPLPQLSDLDTLIAGIERAGVPVDFSVSGTPHKLGEGIELSVFRIVQESLTNAVRHGGPGVSATVAIHYGDDRLDVSVRDDGRGAANRDENGDGHGLVGMRERVAVLGGTFTAGPRPGGGFEIEASLPVETTTEGN